MQKEDRVVFIVALTLFIYAFASLLQVGSFIFPFPLNNLILLIVAAQFFYWNRKQGFPAMLILFTGLLATIGTGHYWSIFLDHNAMTSLTESLITDVFMLCSYLCIILFAISASIRQKNAISIGLTALFVAFFIFGRIFSHLELVVLSYLFMIISNIYKPVYQSLHLIWILLFILDGSQLISFLLN